MTRYCREHTGAIHENIAIGALVGTADGLYPSEETVAEINSIPDKSIAFRERVRRLFDGEFSERIARIATISELRQDYYAELSNEESVQQPAPKSLRAELARKSLSWFVAIDTRFNRALD